MVYERFVGTLFWNHGATVHTVLTRMVVRAEHQNTHKISNLNKGEGTFGGHLEAIILFVTLKNHSVSGG